MRKAILLFISVTLLFNGVTAQRSYKKELGRLDTYFEEALQDWNVPGMAIGIMKDGDVVFSRGYGVSDVETGQPVDGNTLFAIASNSKAFTTTALAMLVEEGKLSWNDKVRNYLPWFEMYAPYVTENMTLRDLVSHRSGLATFSGDLIWYGTEYNPEEVVRRARFLKPVHGFREGYGYSNILYLAAGLVVEEVSGKKWEDFIRERILEPLGMERTLTSVNQLGQFDNVSAPHNDVGDSLITIEWLNWDNIAPAGALISCANDVLRWLEFNLNKGITESGDTLISESIIKDLWAPQTLQRISPWAQRTWPSTHFRAYASGWGVQDYHGVKILSHSGGYDGFITFSSFIPEENMAFTILTNSNSSLFYPLAYKIVDVFLGAEENRDWSSEFLSLIEQREQREKAAREKEEKDRKKNTEPTLPLDAYLGIYSSEAYGDARVYREDGRMMLHLLPTEIFYGKMDHWQYNTWELEFYKTPSLPKGKVNFLIDEKGKVTEMKIDVPNPDFDFTEFRFIKK